MKKLSLLLALFLIIFASCEKRTADEPVNIAQVPVLRHNTYVISNKLIRETGLQEVVVIKNGEVQNEQTGKTFCESEVFELVAGQSIGAGTVMVSNDPENLYVTYQASNGWKIKEVHLYAGSLENVPVNPQNVPVPGQFPINESFNPAVETVSYEISLADLPECPYIVAHAVVVRDGGDETAWGKGDLSFEDTFGIRRWGWLINYCPGDCEGKDLVIATKAYVVDPARYSVEDTSHVGWVVSKGESSVNDCLGLGFNTFNTSMQGEAVYDLDMMGNLSDPKGTMTILITEEEGVKYLNIELKLNAGTLDFSRSYIYVGSAVGLLEGYSFVYSTYSTCYRFKDWHYQYKEISDTHIYKIALSKINE